MLRAAMAGVDIELGLRDGSLESVDELDDARLGETSEYYMERKGSFLPAQYRMWRVTSNPVSFIRSLATRHSQDHVPSPIEADRISRDEFMKVILCQDATPLGPAESKCLSACVAWYTKYLDCRFRNSWTALVRESLEGVSTLPNKPQTEEINLMYKSISIVARLLLEVKGLALVEVVDELANMHLLKDQKDRERAVPNQLIFAAVGWLTMLYDPAPEPAPRELEVRRSSGLFPNRRLKFRSGRVFNSYKHQGFDAFDQPVFMFLRKFGRLIPETASGPVEASEIITVSHVCFAMLDRVADVKIEWVNSLSLHLEFDNVRRVLNVFRFPSFCMMMYRDVTILSNLYLDQCNHFRDHEDEREEQIEDLTPEYFREVLLSYRLIFGQDKASWKAFSKKLPTLEERWDCSDRQSDDGDPMLRILCCSSHTSPDAQQIYQTIDASQNMSPYYYHEADFPFLGRRILTLQTFVSGRNPYNWRILWYDRRNVAVWWTFWVALFIGGYTIFFSALSTGFQIWSSISGQRQLDMSNVSPA